MYIHAVIIYTNVLLFFCSSSSYSLYSLSIVFQFILLAVWKQPVIHDIVTYRMDKPLLKAGSAYHKYKNKRNCWPRVRGVAMNVSIYSLECL